jgi:hypothetical protein
VNVGIFFIVYRFCAVARVIQALIIRSIRYGVCKYYIHSDCFISLPFLLIVMYW